jgi:hypothetical protein
MTHEIALERGYAQLAEIWNEIHDAAEARARRLRYAEGHDRGDTTELIIGQEA